MPEPIAASVKVAKHRPAVSIPAVVAGVVAVASVVGFEGESAVLAAFDKAFVRSTSLAEASAVGRSGDASTVNRRRSPSRSFDGISGSEAFWLGVANPGLARTVAVGEPLTLRAAAGGPELRLVIVDVQEPKRIAPAAETRIDTSLPSADGAGYVIVCRDVQNPDAAEMRFELRHGELLLLDDLTGHML